MKNKNRNGFTLIELLAVIVILAIIALIATPIVLNIISDSKRESIKRSAENYVKSVEQAIMRKNITGEYNPAVCLFEGEENNKVFICYKEPNIEGQSPMEELNVEVEGEYPKDGRIEFENGKIKSYSGIKFGDTYVTKEENGDMILSTEPAAPSTICTLDGAEKDSSKYSAGDKYTCTVATGKDYTFYVLNDTEKTADSVNLILEANIDLTTGEPIKDTNPTNKGLVVWISSTDFIAAGGEDLSNDGGACQYSRLCANNTKGPITAITALKTVTDSWTNLTDMTILGWNSDTSTTNVGTLATPYTLKARLPYYQELTTAGCTTSSNSCPKWLSNYLNTSSKVSQTNPVSGVYGYWTGSAYSSRSGSSWTVYYDGRMIENNVSSDASDGLRPVITVLTSKMG